MTNISTGKKISVLDYFLSVLEKENVWVSDNFMISEFIMESSDNFYKCIEENTNYTCDNDYETEQFVETYNSDFLKQALTIKICELLMREWTDREERDIERMSEITRQILVHGYFRCYTYKGGKQCL